MPVAAKKAPEKKEPEKKEAPKPKQSDEERFRAEAEKWDKEAEGKFAHDHDPLRFRIAKIASDFRSLADAVRQFDRAHDADPEDRTEDRKES